MNCKYLKNLMRQKKNESFGIRAKNSFGSLLVFLIKKLGQNLLTSVINHKLSILLFGDIKCKGPFPLQAWKKAFFVCFIAFFLRSLQF